MFASAQNLDASAAQVPMATGKPEIRVETISDEDRFLELVSVWNRLVEEAHIDHPFSTHEWVRSWWQSFGAGKKLHILVVRAGDRPIAIAPLMLTTGRMYGMNVRKLGFIANVHTPRFDFIVADRTAEVYQTFWTYLRESASSWDVIELMQVLSGSPTLEQLLRLAAKDKYLTGLWHSEDCPYVDFAQGWDALRKSLSHNHRAQMGKRLRRLGRLGPVSLEILSEFDHNDRFLKEGLNIEAAAWKANAGTAILCHPELVNFYRAIAATTAQLGILRLVFLNVAGERIAFAYALFHKNKIYVLKSGYRPDYAAYSPYLLLCHLLFQRACEEGISEYEFLGASDPWKLRWTDKTKPQYWAYIMPRKLRTSLIHAVKFRALPHLRQQRLYSALRDQINIVGAIMTLIAV